MPARAKLAVAVALFPLAAPWEEAAAQEEEPAPEVVLVELVNPLPVPVDVVSGAVDVNNVVEVTAPDGIEVTAPDGIDVAVTNVVVPVQDEWQRPYQRTQGITLSSGTGNGLITFPLPSGFYLVVTHVWAQTRVPTAQNATVAVSGEFSGSSFTHALTLSSVVDGTPITNTYVSSLALSLYCDDEFTLIVTRLGGTTGEILANVTVTGYLLPVGGTNPR